MIWWSSRGGFIGATVSTAVTAGSDPRTQEGAIRWTGILLSGIVVAILAFTG
jgi:hypothetical protein